MLAPVRLSLDEVTFASLTNLPDATLTYSQLRIDSLRLAASIRSKHNLEPTTFDPYSSKAYHINPVALVVLPNCLPFSPIVYGCLSGGLTASGSSSLLYYSK
jgi:acyl-CoA synthetase (AMP-forming)/AMP-acid ligase II